jgi:amino acid adenylation domain-containing protein
MEKEICHVGVNAHPVITSESINKGYMPKCIYKLFEETVGKNAKSVCIEAENKVYTYAEVNEKANQLARYIKNKGVNPGDYIGIYMERTAEMIISILAVLKSGAAYVPMESGYPADRLEYIINHVKPKLILTTSSLQNKMPAKGLIHITEIITIDTERTSIERESIENLDFKNDLSDLAYIIFTSGSTGRPKGVMIEHYGLENLVREQIKVFKLSNEDRVLQFATIVFDASVSEIFTTLIAGAVLVLLPTEGLFIGRDLYQVLKSKRISVTTLSPSVLNTLPTDELPDLKTLVSAGEACSRRLIDYWVPRVRFINAYGPTEATVCATMKVYNTTNEALSIGNAIKNAAVYILNKQLNPVNEGEKGELYISAVGLARGYFEDDEVTKASFMKNPFQDGFSTRIYKTGDICRLLPGNEIEWIDRVDSQVKLSGLRIEPGEIENLLQEHPSIQQAVVRIFDDRLMNKYLSAYMKADGGNRPGISEIRNYLRSKIPEYMLPSRFAYVDEFTMLPNGKVDREKLPILEFYRSSVDIEYVEPSNDMEKALAQIWSDVLNVDKVGICDNFFDLGGHSIMATQIVSRIRSSLDIDIPISVIFSITPTVEQTALAIERYQLEQFDIEDLQMYLEELEGLEV